MKTSDDNDFPTDRTDITNVVYEPAPSRSPAPQPTITIAEAFQEMLWQAFKAGTASMSGTRDAFERWYNTEVAK